MEIVWATQPYFLVWKLCDIFSLYTHCFIKLQQVAVFNQVKKIINVITYEPDTLYVMPS